MRKKIVSPGHRRQMARGVVEAGMCSGRAVCRILGLATSTFWYRGRGPSEKQRQLLQRMRELSDQYPRYGYRRIAALLRQEGWPVGKRHIQRLTTQCSSLVSPITAVKIAIAAQGRKS